MRPYPHILCAGILDEYMPGYHLAFAHDQPHLLPPLKAGDLVWLTAIGSDDDPPPTTLARITDNLKVWVGEDVWVLQTLHPPISPQDLGSALEL